jgi:hypothetical protein
VRLACDVDKDVSEIARRICVEHQRRLIEFLYETQSPHKVELKSPP